MYIRYVKECSKGDGKLGLYFTVKKNYGLEPYLMSNIKVEWKRAIAKLRLSSHPFPVETQRKLNIPRTMRTCTLCRNGKVGDEYHYLFECTACDILRIRTELCDRLVSINSAFKQLDSKCQFQYLLSLADRETWVWLGVALVKLYKVVKRV